MATAPPGNFAGYAAPMPASSAQSDLEGVGHLKIGSGLGIVVQALFWLGFLIFYLIFTALQNTATALGTGGTSTIPSWITVNIFYIAVAAIAGGLFLGIVSFVPFFLGFRAIRRGDPTFGAPTTLMIVGLVGYLMMALGIVVIVGSIVTSINSATAGAVSTGSASVDLGAILGGLALIGFGALLSLIGVIGLVLGNWRAGSRFDESTAKVGAILSIIPYLSIVGYVLLLVGYVRAGSKLRSGWAPRPPMGQMGAPAYYPPPPSGIPQPGNYPTPPPPP